jgi:transcriptional regulator with XRE-family HTH domain
MQRNAKGGDNIGTINDRVKAVRKARGMTLEEFGKQLGIGKSAVSKLEKGLCKVTDQNVLSICRVFDVNEDWLRNGTGGPDAMFNAPALDDLVEQLAQHNILVADARSPGERRFLLNSVKNAHDKYLLFFIPL